MPFEIGAALIGAGFSAGATAAVGAGAIAVGTAAAVGTYEEVRKVQSKAAAARRAGGAQPLAPGPLAPLPPGPTEATLDLGASTERLRRKRARTRSQTIFSQGLLVEDPAIYSPKLGGLPSPLGG